MTALLPIEFADLEGFADWALPTTRQRNHKRLTSSMDQIQPFYDAMLTRIDAILAYLDGFNLQEMPADAQRLMWMALSLAEVSDAIELFHEPGVTGGCDPSRFVVIQEPNP
ncbi:MAG TPA: hypothetical protein VMD75_12010 [Candidatus Binataceae bacterium]|nr:hypothetical protein [Candidatus Binataceae bacterium]